MNSLCSTRIIFVYFLMQFVHYLFLQLIFFANDYTTPTYHLYLSLISSSFPLTLSSPLHIFLDFLPTTGQASLPTFLSTPSTLFRPFDILEMQCFYHWCNKRVEWW